jgi:hypothetical protein
MAHREQRSAGGRQIRESQRRGAGHSDAVLAVLVASALNGEVPPRPHGISPRRWDGKGVHGKKEGRAPVVDLCVAYLGWSERRAQT